MKFFRMLGPVAVVAALMMFGVSGARATIFTSPEGTEYSGAIKLELKKGTPASFKNSFFGEIQCVVSTLEGKVKSQGTTATAQVELSTFNFKACGGSFASLQAGVLEAHTSGASPDGNGTLTSNGAEITLEIAGIHCILSTSTTSLGTLTGGSPATLTASASVPRTGGRSGAFCGSSFTFHAEYKVVTPEALLVD